MPAEADFCRDENIIVFFFYSLLVLPQIAIGISGVQITISQHFDVNEGWHQNVVASSRCHQWNNATRGLHALPTPPSPPTTQHHRQLSICPRIMASTSLQSRTISPPSTSQYFHCNYPTASVWHPLIILLHDKWFVKCVQSDMWQYEFYASLKPKRLTKEGTVAGTAVTVLGNTLNCNFISYIHK